jgi:hypothetical protein
VAWLEPTQDVTGTCLGKVTYPGRSDHTRRLANDDLIREKVMAGEYEFAMPHFFEEMANRDSRSRH